MDQKVSIKIWWNVLNAYDLNSFDTMQIEVPLYTEENSQLTQKFCAQNDRLNCSSSHGVSLQHVHNLDPPCRVYYYAFEQPQNA